MITISAVIATTNRPALHRTLASLESQNRIEGDESIVIHDHLRHHDWGAWARQEGMGHATGDALCFMDDDDAWAPGAFDIIRSACHDIRDNPAIHIFRMLRHDPWDDYVWTVPTLDAPGQVGTPMIVVPNIPNYLGSWICGRYDCDYAFATSTRDVSGWPVVWHEDVIAEIYRE